MQSLHLNILAVGTDLLTQGSAHFKRLAIVVALVAAINATNSTTAQAAAEDILVGAFDRITGVPVMGAMLGLVRSGERSSQSPDVLDQRLREVEAMLQAVDGRLRLVEGRLGQLQNEVVKIANINRLRELQRIRAEIAEINIELLTHPTDPAHQAILEFRAHQQADLLKDNVDFDIWKWSDVDPTNQLVRTRFHVLPSFELYGLALTTWISAIEMKNGTQPQRIVAESGPSLRQHVAFLRLRDGWRELRTDAPSDPLTLREHLHTAAFCRLEAAQSFADHAGNCAFVEVCIDTMEDKQTETGRVTLTMQPPTVGTLCTWNPDQAFNFEGEAQLRADHGALVMSALADALERLAISGSLREPFIGEFPNWILGAIFSVALDWPLQAPRGATPGVSPIFHCPLFSGCVLGPDSDEAHWKIGGTPLTIRHLGSSLCLDVKGSVPSVDVALVLWFCNGSPSQQWRGRRSPTNNQQFTLVSNVGGLCATVSSPPRPGQVAVESSRRLSLQPCDGRELQTFSNTDSTLVGPH